MSEQVGGTNAVPARLDDWYAFWQRGETPKTIEIVLIHKIRR